MKIVPVLFLFYFFTAFPSVAQWTQQASQPGNGRSSSVATTANGKCYAGMGQNNLNVYLHDFWEYNPSTNTWTQKADYPGGGYHGPTSFSIQNKVYVCLGFSTSHVCQNDLWEYNPATNTWTQKATFPGTARYGAGSFVIGDSAFIVCGSYNASNNYLTDLWMYNPSTNTWKSKAGFPGGKRAFGTAFALNGCGYYGTGLSNGTTPKKDFWKYNPVTNSWSSIPNFPGTARCGTVSFTANGMALVGFGTNLSTIYNDIGVYDPISNTWQSVTLPQNISPRDGGIAFTINNVGYIGLGKNTTTLSDLWAFGQTLPDIQGTISYQNMDSSLLSGVVVSLQQGNNTIDTAITNSSGYYSFSGIPEGTYTLKCASITPWGGVNTTDALLILKHFARTFFLNGLAFSAADVNHSTYLNVSDALLVYRRFSGFVNSFPSGDWLFQNPSVTFSVTNPQTANIKGICFGDVNGSYIPPY